MERKTFIETIAPKLANGCYLGMTMKKDMKAQLTAAAKASHNDGDLVKITRTVVRLGVIYSNISTVAAKIVAEGLDKENINRTLPWGEWDPDCSYLIRKEDANSPDGYKYYVRCTITKNKRQKSYSVWYYKGQEISVDEVKALGILKNSYWTKSDPEEIFTEPLECITEIRQSVKAAA